MHRTQRRPARGALRQSCGLTLAGILPLFAGCTWFRSNQEVLITSDPPGAHIFIDGRDSGETTPHAFEMAGNFGSDHVIELRRQGFRPELRALYQYTRFRASRWIDGGGPVELPAFPVSWTAGDVVFPLGVHGAVVPGEVFVRMYREDEPLLGFDVLAARERAASLPAGPQ